MTPAAAGKPACCDSSGKAADGAGLLKLRVDEVRFPGYMPATAWKADHGFPRLLPYCWNDRSL